MMLITVSNATPHPPWCLGVQQQALVRAVTAGMCVGSLSIMHRDMHMWIVNPQQAVLAGHEVQLQLCWTSE